MPRLGRRKTPEQLARLIDRGEAALAAKVAGGRRGGREAQRRRREGRKQKAAEWRAARRARLGYQGLRNEERQIGDKPGWLVLWGRMAPGAWYARPDLVALMPEYRAGSVDAWSAQKLVQKGMIERTLNPNRRPRFVPDPSLTRQQRRTLAILDGVQARPGPRYLFRRVELDASTRTAA